MQPAVDSSRYPDCLAILPVEPREPTDSPPLSPPAERGIAETPAPPGSGADSPLPRTPVFTLIVASGAVAALAAAVTGLALISVRPSPAAVTAQPVQASQPTQAVDAEPVPTWTSAQGAGRAADGSRTVTFTLEAVHELPAWMSRVRPALAVRCLSRATEVFVMLDTSIAFEREADRRTVRVQWDDGPVSIQQWDISESSRELFVPDGIAFARRMAIARRLRIGFTPFNAAPVTAEFAVEGFDRLADRVARTCGWRLGDAPVRG